MDEFMTHSSIDDPQGNFSRLTDMQVMRVVLQDHLSKSTGRQVSLDACRMRFARYRTYLKPQSRKKSVLSVCYEVQIAACSGRPPERQMFSGKAHLNGGSRSEYEAYVGAADGSLTREIWHLADLDLVLWRFPLDPRMPQLTILADAQRVSEFLPFAAMGESTGEIEHIDTQVMAYRPEVRCTARLGLHFANGRRRDIIAKSFADESGALVTERIRHLHETPAYRAAGLRVPRPMGYASAIKTVWTEYVGGADLTSMMTGPRANALMNDLGGALAALHSGHAPVTDQVTRADLLFEARKKAQKLGASLPNLRPLLTRLVADCEVHAGQLGSEHYRPIHGDLHLRQVLVADDELVFLDFDEMRLGELEQDLASLFVDLRHGNPDGAQPLCEHFCRGYVRSAGRIDSGKLAWYTTIQWLNKAYRTFWQQAPDHAAQVRNIVHCAAGTECQVGSSPC